MRIVLILLLSVPVPLAAQTVTAGNRFGEVINLGGTPQDLVLDELRGRIYMVNANANRVDIYNIREKRVDGQIPTGTFPVAAAMSMDGSWLYVANTGSSSITVVELGADQVRNTVSLPTRPEGVAVGVDGRVLITTQGSGQNNTVNTLLLFDPRQDTSSQLIGVPSPPTITTPVPLPPVFAGRPATAFPGRLIRTPDGNFIVGMVAINQTANTAQTTLFVYEVASGTVLRNRSVTGQSTVLAMSPDGSRFMAGSTQYDTATLAVNAQQNVANLPFFLNGTFSNGFNVQFNFGGSTFAPDGETLYSAFNNAPTNTRPTATTLFISNPRHLGTRLGLRLPESVLGKMVILSDGTEAWALSESGVLRLPLAEIFDRPILVPETTQVFLAIDECNKGIARASIRIGNIGQGKLTYAVPNTGAALVAQVSSGVAPSTVTFVMEPGRAGVTRQAGTNLFTGSATNQGTPVNVTLQSPEAINLPNTIRVYMNFRQNDQRGMVHPVPTTLAGAEGLWDMVLDEPRGRLYITNSGYNRLEVFDTVKQRFLDPVEVGQLPHAMAMSLDGSTLYVGNTGGESIVTVDLDTLRLTGAVEFPPLPRAGNTGVINPQAMAMGLSGLQFMMSNGGFWKVVGNTATVRTAQTLLPATIAGPRYMSATPGGEQVVTMSGTGTAYLYDALIDQYVSSRLVYNQAPIGYFGPLAGAPAGAFYLAGGQILSSALTPVGGSERPGVTQFNQPTQPGQFPTQTIVSAGQRNVAAVAPLTDRAFLRMTTPVRQNIATPTRDEARTTLESIDVGSQSESVAAIMPENPVNNVLGTNRANVPSRQIVVDSKGTAYAITLSGLTAIPLAPQTTGTQPQLPGGARSIVNSNDGTQTFRPGSFITVNGAALAGAAKSETLPLPTVLGGTCVTFNDIPLPLIQTSPTQISAQIPAEVRPGQNVVQIRSLSNAQYSTPVVVTVQRP